MGYMENFTELEIAVLEARARRIAQSSTQDGTDTTISVLGLKIGSEQYAMMIDSLVGVYKDIKVVAVPCTPNFVAGVANVRGRIVTVIELSNLLNVPDAETSGLHPLVAVANDNMTLAFRVEAIADVSNSSLSDLQPAPTNFDAAPAAYVKGLLPDGSVLLDTESILADPRLIIDEKIG